MENCQSQQRESRSSWCSCLLSPIVSFLQQFQNLFNPTPIPPYTDASQSPNPLPSLDTSSSSITNSLPLPIGKFEVFRGPDTRRIFTDFLYTFLDHSRIRTYRDDEELHKGEEIGPELLAAISNSKIAIPIFSRDYAGSKWCLREITKIVECKIFTGQKILPVFYHVEPSDVRHQTGCYAEAFCRHEKHFDANTV